MPEVPLMQYQYKHLVTLIAPHAGVLMPLDRQNLLELTEL
jgi:hypothetical protein